MEKKMETTMVYWGYIRIVEKNMEANYYLGFRVKGFKVKG